MLIMRYETKYLKWILEKQSKQHNILEEVLKKILVKVFAMNMILLYTI